jgi:hypothetical protein
MKPGFLLSGPCTEPKNSQAHAQSQSRSRHVVGGSQSSEVQPSSEMLWWARLFWNKCGDFRHEHEPSSIITRLMAKQGYTDPWEVADLPGKLTVVTAIEAKHHPRELRLVSELSRDRFSLYMWHQQSILGLPFLAGCDWCGTPTGHSCDCCFRTSICSDCEDDFHRCKDCSD